MLRPVNRPGPWPAKFSFAAFYNSIDLSETQVALGIFQAVAELASNPPDR